MVDVRWHAKKWTRWLVSGTSWPRGLRRSDPSVRVLTYHGIGDVRRNPFYLDRGQFELQIAYLAEHRLVLSLDDLDAYLAGRRGVPRGAVVVTIDDGLRSLHRDALPILRDHGVPAVAFVSPGLLESTAAANPQEAQDEPFLSWKELEAVQAAGIEIGSHGFSHRSLGVLPAPEAEEEIRRSRAVLEQRLGCRIRAMAYPYGTRPDFNAGTRSALERAGYRFAFTSQHGAITPGSDPLVLSRIKVEGGDSISLFRRLTIGGMDAWRVVDGLLWRIQATP